MRESPRAIVPCSVPGCEKVTGINGTARGLCRFHYSRSQRGKPFDSPMRGKASGCTCSVDGCERDVLAKGLCVPHWERQYRHGDPTRGGPLNGRNDTHKWCEDCDTVKPFSEFFVREGKPSIYCRACTNVRSKNFYRSHKAECYERSLRWKILNREHCNARTRARYALDPSKHIAKTQARNALIRGAKVCDLTNAQWLEILEYHDNRCAYCLRKADELEFSLEQDHIIAVSRGGNHTAENIVPACKSCNARKNNRSVYFMAAATTPTIAR